jgi:multidrug efflux system membrane fusion protein
MTSYAWGCASVGALLALGLGASPALNAQAGAAPPQPITVAAGEQARLGVVIESLAAAQAPAGAATTARVLDPGPLLQLDADLTAASASLAASRAEASRTRKLYTEDRTASARAVETADAQAQADLQRVNGVQRRLLLEWGEGVAGLPGRRRAALLNDLAHVRSELVRVELPPEAPLPPAGTVVRLQSNAAATVMPAKVLGMLPVADPRLQTRGLLAELTGAQATLAVGQMLSAQLPASAAAPPGVVIPRGALLRKDSLVWAYVQQAPTTFVRREVKGYQPLATGWFVPGGFAPGERVVTAGAAALLGVETPTGGSGD